MDQLTFQSLPSTSRQIENSTSTENTDVQNKRSLDDEEEKSSGKAAKRRKVIETNKLKFEVNKDAMLEFAEECLDPELKLLGVTSFNQNTYEQGVIDQLEKAITTVENTGIVQEESLKLDDKLSISNSSDKGQESEDDSGEEIDDPNDKDFIVESQDEDEGNQMEDVGQCLDDDVDQFEEAPESCFLPRKKKWSNLELGLDKSNSKVEQHILDDGDEATFKRRMAEYRLHRAELNIVDGDEQYYQICDKLRIPTRIWDRLFVHQKECLRWLWGLHMNLCGGIIGDEMGLGKTIQVIAYLVALKCSTYREVGHLYPSLGPVLLVCPATVMHQWVHEFHSWWPPFRVAILHHTGTYLGTKRSLIKDIFRAGGVLITTYNGVCAYSKELTEYSWHYVVLDEGHKIRNPEANVTHCCKLVSTIVLLISFFRLTLIS